MEASRFCHIIKIRHKSIVQTKELRFYQFPIIENFIRYRDIIMERISTDDNIVDRVIEVLFQQIKYMKVMIE